MVKPYPFWEKQNVLSLRPLNQRRNQRWWNRSRSALSAPAAFSYLFLAAILCHAAPLRSLGCDGSRGFAGGLWDLNWTAVIWLQPQSISPLKGDLVGIPSKRLHIHHKIQVGELYRLLRSDFLDFFVFLETNGETSNKGVCIAQLTSHVLFVVILLHQPALAKLMLQRQSLGMRLCASKEFILESKYASYVSLKSSPVRTVRNYLDFNMISNSLKKLCVLYFTFGTGPMLRTWMMIAMMSSLVRMG